jgi:hypothetical protein
MSLRMKISYRWDTRFARPRHWHAASAHADAGASRASAIGLRRREILPHFDEGGHGDA